MHRDRQFFQKGVNMYVPAMQYSMELIHGEPTPFSLGSPAAVSATAVTSGVAANAVATTVVALAADWISDSPYGRTLRLTPSGDPGNSAAVDVRGFDYLGQPMSERFTGANGSTAILYGKKAFYRVVDTKIATAASNAVTWSVGTGFRLGLPFKGDISWAKEAGLYVPLFKRDQIFWVDRSGALAAAGGSKWIRADYAGFVKTLIGIADGGGSTNDPVITVKLGGTAITGLTVTIDTSAAGNMVTDTPTTVGYNANNRFRPGDLIEIVGASAASALGDRLGLELTPTQMSLADTTDPQTTSTGDPRGTYEANLTYDAASEIIVGMFGDNSVNASNNGGLYGIKHVTS